MPLELEQADRANGRSLLRKINALHPDVDAALVGGQFFWCTSSGGLSKLHSLLAALEKISSSAKIIRFVPRERYLLLNGYLSNYVSRLSLPSRIKNELALLSCRLAMQGYALVGDIVQMRPAQIIACAMTVPAVRDPEKTASRLEEALGKKGLGLDMRAPHWVRDEGPTVEQMIVQRNLKRVRDARLPKRLRQTHLHLIT